MYITNPEIIPESHKYKTNNKKISDWLQINQHIPLLSQDKSGNYIFAKTDNLEEALTKIPFWLKLYSKF